jgi:hypothetical protein
MWASIFGGGTPCDAIGALVEARREKAIEPKGDGGAGAYAVIANDDTGEKRNRF